MNQSTNVPSDAERAEALAAVEAKRTEKIRAFQVMLASKLERGIRTEAEFAKQVTENGLLWAIEWAGRAAAIIAAETAMWRQVEAAYFSATNAERKDEWVAAAVGAVKMIRAEVERQLLKNYVVKSSTDAFANAVSGAQAEGYARFYEDAGGIVDYLTATDNK
jgi:hypothetical protein